MVYLFYIPLAKISTECRHTGWMTHVSSVNVVISSCHVAALNEKFTNKVMSGNLEQEKSVNQEWQIFLWLSGSQKSARMWEIFYCCFIMNFTSLLSIQHLNSADVIDWLTNHPPIHSSNMIRRQKVNFASIKTISCFHMAQCLWVTY